MEKRKVLIVDDELPALNVLVTMLAKRPDLEIVLATTEYQVAYDYLDENDVDLLIVDLDLRVDSGYNLMAAVEPPTQIIVCTASEREGSEAIYHGAIDFVVKMVQEDRLIFAVDRALRQLELLEHEQANRVYPSTVAVQLETSDAFVNVRVGELVYARSEGKSTYLCLANGHELLAKKLLRNLQLLLNPAEFIRIQKGFIVSREAIDHYLPGALFKTKNWWVELRDEVASREENSREPRRLPVGERYRHRVEKALGIR
ncbi:LytR/AlgR family response regulator transcription factor [Parapedobacter koreensis]|uniref:Two component transcriptional regulator, LytTR family n=1 Tax=Parapedobacter koreensis TaxID=332977 RepID=A0A1H7NKM7_9SPHI|nr:LytTR family DNA-binding domain-containing protein [Parapedobacter koreensis]SEL24112.1 two component transcriptional regulator, LytTR family [Parapedobacter koreensis]